MRCEEIHAQLADHLAGTLLPDAADAVADHLRTCPSCAAEVEGLNDTWQQLGRLPGHQPDSSAMRARFDAALEGYQRGLNARIAEPRLVRLRTYGLQFAAAAAMVVLGVAIGRQTTRPTAPDPQLAILREELRDMRQMVTLSLLQQQSASERLKGVSFTSQIEQPDSAVTVALLDMLMHDPNVNVRLATIDALKRLASREAVLHGVIEALPRQTSPLVQIALIDFIVEKNGRGAADTLRQLSTDEMLDRAVRARALQGLQRLG
jgi:hypothetical protein